MKQTHLARRLVWAVLGMVAGAAEVATAATVVGRTEASYGVTQNGAATYTIPIQATEGINGMTPRLAVSYAGPGSRSILGVGFALSGLSYITACRKTIAQDLNAAPVTLTAADRYCLDGARLRLVSGTYGATNATYRTELDQIVRVTSLGSSGNIPGSFKVEMPNGLEYVYGGSANSKLMSGTGGGATPQFWAVSKITDTSDNSIVFTYDSDAATQRFRPTAISYTERGGSGHYRVEFVYRTQPQLPVLYFTPSLVGGAAQKEDKVLERIDLEHDNVRYRAYKFTYEAGAGDNERLKQVQECAYDPSEDCIPPTVFTWQSATDGHDALASTGRTVAAGVMPLDINGDGIEDLAWAASGTWRYMLGGASGFGSIVNTSVAATNPTKAMSIEWNGDGFWDLLIDWSDGKWRVLRGGASGFNTTVVAAGPGGIVSTTPNTSWTLADVDADGRDDLISVALNAALAINVRYNGASGFGAMTTVFQDPFVHTKASNPFIPNNGSSSAIRRPDFNGDGRTDLLIFGCIWETEPPGWCLMDRWFQILSQGTTFTNEGPITGAAFNIYVRYGDFNGDGLTDAVYPATTGVWNLGFGQGSGGFAFVAGPSSAPHATYRTLTGDYDGDGLDDLYVARNSPNEWEVIRGTGTGLSTTALSPSPAISAAGSGWMLIDQNGDSLPDLGRYDTGTPVWSLGTHKGKPAERLLTATDGLANIVRFSYLPMTSNTVYVKGTGATFPEREFEGSVPLVRTMQFDPAGANGYTMTYKYLNARIHGQGRSFLGMGQREITDSRNGLFTVETYRQDFPYIGAPATVTVRQSSAGGSETIQSATHTYNLHVLSSASGNERYLPYRSKTITTGHEVGGVRDGDPITEVTETHTVNTWGNSAFVSIDVKDVDALSPEMGQIYRTEVASTFIEDSTNWCIALPRTRDESRILPLGAGSAARELDWVVDGAECRVDKETVEEGGGSLVSLVTDIGYDDCGNVDQITSTPAGISGQERVTSIDYGTRCQRPMTITNPEDHVSGIDYDWRVALVTTSTDPNGLVSTLERDAFGRLTRQLRPDGTGVRVALTACTSGNNWCSKGSSAARVKVTRTERTTSDGTIRTDEQFLDGIGRVRWTHTASLESGAAIVETLYDAFNRPVGRTQPYFAGGGSYPTAYTYDLIGRILSVDAPVSETQTSGRVTGFSYQGRTLEVTNPKNLTTTRLNSVLGQLRSLTDPSPGGITTYAYHPFGELKSITDAAGNVTSWSLNTRGFLTGTSDPDSGSWTYQVNAFGETEKIRDAKTNAPNWTTEFTFDKLGRPLSREEAEGDTDFTWGNASHNTASNKYIGRLKQVTSPGGYKEIYTFDLYSRLSKLRTTIDGANWDFDQSYWASTGMPSVLTYPVIDGGFRLRVNHSFQENILETVSHYQNPTVFWEALQADAWGNYENASLGNGVAAFQDFDQASGLPDTRTAWHSSTPLIDANVDWDLNGNVTKREDLQQSLDEIFVYDNLNRVASSTLNGNPNGSVSLNNIGNITVKDGQNYVYTGAQSGCTYYTHIQPRAVRKIGSTVYCYDKNGNMVKRGGSNISFTSFNLPSTINSGGNSSSLYYGAFRNRYKQVAVASGSTETTTYVGGLFERVVRPSKPTEYRHYIPTGDGATAIYTRRSDGSTDVYYLQSDHLGSPELVTDTDGDEHLRFSFAAYGARRNPTTWSGAPPGGDLTKIADTTRTGFTGHEYLDSVELIHMNGRVYDPGAGRFLSRDPFIDGVSNSQGSNGYTYVRNNPLRFIDPSGYECVWTGRRAICDDVLPEVPVFGSPVPDIGHRGVFNPLPPHNNRGSKIYKPGRSVGKNERISETTKSNPCDSESDAIDHTGGGEYLMVSAGGQVTPFVVGGSYTNTFLWSPGTSRVLHYWSLSAGPGLGLSAGAIFQTGSVWLDSPNDFTGIGIQVSGFLAGGGVGVSGTAVGSAANLPGISGSEYYGLEVGGAYGAGGSLSGEMTYTSFVDEIDFSDMPKDVQSAMCAGPG